MTVTEERIVRFGVFEVDLRSGEVRKAGRRIALQEQPFRVLVRLLEHPGQVVTREQLRADLWPADTFVDFEQGLNGAVKRLREALGDSADSPRYIETLARRGYRFIGPLNGTGPLPASPTQRVRASHSFFLLAIGAVTGAVLIWLLPGRPSISRLWNQQSSPTPVMTFRSLIDVSPAESLNATGTGRRNGAYGPDRGGPYAVAVAVAPDGRRIVFSGVQGNRRQLYVRALDRLEAEPLAGTDDGENPFFSPDGTWVGYWNHEELRRIRPDGGPPTTICATGGPLFGATWDAADRVVFGDNRGNLWQVRASGGSPEQLTVVDRARGEVSHRLPHALPNGDVLFTITYNQFPTWTETRLAVFSRERGSHRVVLDGGADGRYVASGHLVYLRSGALMAAPFDLLRLKVTGPSLTVTSGIRQLAYSPFYPANSGAGQFSVSAGGTLVYVPGGVVPDEPRAVHWVSRAGIAQRLELPPRPYAHPRVSPDGTRVAVATVQSEEHIWIYSLARHTLTRLTTEGRNGAPVWSPDGRRIAFRSSSVGLDNLFCLSTDGSSLPQRLTTTVEDEVPAAWSSNGRVLAFYRITPPPIRVWTLSLGGAPTARELVSASRAVRGGVDISPDGKWLAYASVESGRLEVYVEAFPSGSSRQQISTDGGTSPVWRHDGRELFFVWAVWGSQESSVLRVMSVQVSEGPVPRFGAPKLLFEGPYDTSFPSRAYDVAPDGQHFVFIERPQTPVVPLREFVLVQNWFEELKAKVPSK